MAGALPEDPPGGAVGALAERRGGWRRSGCAQRLERRREKAAGQLGRLKKKEAQRAKRRAGKESRPV